MPFQIPLSNNLQFINHINKANMRLTKIQLKMLKTCTKIIGNNQMKQNKKSMENIWIDKNNYNKQDLALTMINNNFKHMINLELLINCKNKDN